MRRGGPTALHEEPGSPQRHAAQNEPKLCSTPDNTKRNAILEGSPNFQALFRDLPDLTPPRAKMSYSTFTGASPSTSEFGFPRLGMPEGQSPDRQRLGIDLLQRSTPAPVTMLSPSSRNGLGMPPLPIFQPSPLRGLQGQGTDTASGYETNHGANGEFGVERRNLAPNGRSSGLGNGTGHGSATKQAHPVLNALSALNALGVPGNNQAMSQASTFLSCLSPDGSSKLDPAKRLSDASDFGRFSLSPNPDVKVRNGGMSAYSSAFAEIMDSHSRVSPKDIKDLREFRHGDFSLRLEGLSSDEKDPMASPLQLSKRSGRMDGHRDDMNGKKRTLDFSNVHLSPVKQSLPIGISPMVGSDSLLPIHPLDSKDTSSSELGLALNGTQRDGDSTIKKEDKAPRPANGRRASTSNMATSMLHSQASMDALAQSPVGVKLGIMRPEDIIDSPAVKQATKEAVAAAMKANAEMLSRGMQLASRASSKPHMSSPRRAVHAAAHASVPSRRASRRESTNAKPRMAPEAAALDLLYDGPIASENNGATKCKCKRSKCLKLYCECFKAKGYCGVECSCTCCQNKAGHEDQILEAREGILARNPLAFTEKIAETNLSQGGDGKGTLGHTRGCNCKKSRCEKKYCECFQAGVFCGDHCKCTGCLNCAKANSNSTASAQVASAPVAEASALHSRKRRKTHTSRDDPTLADVQPNAVPIAGLTPVTNPSLRLDDE